MTVWKDKDGREIDIVKFEDDHLKNIIKLILKRESQGFKIKQYDQMAMRIGDLIEELYRRNLSLKDGILFSDRATCNNTGSQKAICKPEPRRIRSRMDNLNYRD